MPTTVDYLGMRFLDADLTGIRAALTRALDGLFGYVVTPNVDHVVSYHDGGAALRAAYDGALFQICDSRVLAGMAAFSGVRLRPCPGSDLTDDILRRPLRPGLRVGVIGPDAQAFERLRGLFPGPSFVFLPSSARLVVGSAEWNETVAAAAAAEWDILLICLSFPKQEFFAQALARSGRLDEAQFTFDKMLTYANHLGLYAEEIGLTGEQLGNFPQAFTHLALISAAFNLDRQLG